MAILTGKKGILTAEEQKTRAGKDKKYLYEKCVPNYFNSLMKQYNYTNNPLYVWKAILVCKSYDVDIPSWAQEYLKESSSELFGKLLEREKDRKDGAPAGERANNIVYSCLGFHGRDQFNSYLEYQKQMKVCGMLNEYYQKHPEKSELDIYLAVGEKTGIPYKTIETWWRKHSTFWNG